jgi:hypothetical protein
MEPVTRAKFNIYVPLEKDERDKAGGAGKAAPIKRKVKCFRIDLSTFRRAPLYLWLLIVPGVLLALWVWQVLRRRSDTHQWIREHVVPVAERYRFVGDLGFWFSSSSHPPCALLLARPEARIQSYVTAARISCCYRTDRRPWPREMSVRSLAPFDAVRPVVRDSLPWKVTVWLLRYPLTASPQVRLTNDPNALFFFPDHLRDAGFVWKKIRRGIRTSKKGCTGDSSCR